MVNGKGSKPRPLAVSRQTFSDNWDLAFHKPKPLVDGKPCGRHRNCLSHVTHPCEGCGRIRGYPVQP